MKRILPLIILFLQVLNLSCEYDTQYFNTIDFAVENKSSKPMSIKEVVYNSTWSSTSYSPISVEPNNSCTLLSWVNVDSKQITELPIAIDNYIPNKMHVIFEENFAVEYIREGFDEGTSGIIYVDKCIVNRVKDGEIKITYTLTDKDYEYAKEHGVKLSE